ncbi:hypothetical protein T484DRAFT_1803924, partial [Baffinella frigidus]
VAANADALKILLEAKADVNGRTESLDTPLHLAARLGNDKVCTLLLAHGAKAMARNLRCETPLDVAGLADATKV